MEIIHPILQRKASFPKDRQADQVEDDDELESVRHLAYPVAVQEFVNATQVDSQLAQTG